jgi:hypothetical protein
MVAASCRLSSCGTCTDMASARHWASSGAGLSWWPLLRGRVGARELWEESGVGGKGAAGGAGWGD